MNKIFLFFSLIFFNGCNENITSDRLIDRVNVNIDNINDTNLTLSNEAENEVYYDIFPNNIYKLDVPDSYNIQIGTKDEIKECVLFNGLKFIEDPFKKTIYIKCKEHSEWNFDIHDSYGVSNLDIDLFNIYNPTFQVFKTNINKSLLVNISGKRLDSDLENGLIDYRFANKFVFNAIPLNELNDIKISLLEIINNIKYYIPIESIVINEKLPDEANSLDYDDSNLILIDVDIKTSIPFKGYEYLKILINEILNLFGLPEVSKLLSANRWDIKSIDTHLRISVRKKIDETVDVEILIVDNKWNDNIKDYSFIKINPPAPEGEE